jgi:heme-degrading monooxygenase HmoA
MTEPRIRVLVYVAAPPTAPDAVSRAYHRISAELAVTPGLIGNELMRSAAEPTGYVVMSEWANMAAFRAWEEGPGHRGVTAPLRRYQDERRGSPFGLYEVIASY